MTDGNGVDRRPKLMKSRAILAVLAATPGHSHSRSWFQSLLWQDRQHQQAQSSLRSAIADIRRHLGPHASALISDHSEIGLRPDMVSILPQSSLPRRGFLEGFDVPHAQVFEEWLRVERSAREPAPDVDEPRLPLRPASAASGAAGVSEPLTCRIYLASGEDGARTMTRMQCDAVADSIAKSTEDLRLAETVDGRGKSEPLPQLIENARASGCSIVLLSEAAETTAGVIARLRAVETERGQLIWSKSLTGITSLDLEAPATMAVVAEFVDILSERLIRPYGWQHENMPAPLLAIVGMNHIFKLGSQNFESAEALLKRAHEMDPRGSYLAWRAYLRTALLGEQEPGDREAIVEEGTALARRALEMEPHNSMVLALCAHVENMLHNAYGNAFDLSARALELNRCNPLAWASLGVAAAYLDKTQEGYALSRISTRLASGTRFAYLAETLAASACLVSGRLGEARSFAELGHSKAPTYAPPLRFLTALYCFEGKFDRAEEMAANLRVREPDFSLGRLSEDGYPTDSLRRANILKSLPIREI